MEDAGYHYDGAEGKPVWGHDLVTTHYVNGDAEYPVRLGLYVKKEACHKKGSAFKTKIQLACEQIAAFKPPAGTETVVAFDSWFFCRQVTEAAEAKGYSWVTQAEANRIVYHEGQRMNVTQLAEIIPEKGFRTVKVRGEAFTLHGLRVWMPKLGNVKMVISKEEDGFHFYVTNRPNFSDRQVLEAYKVRQTIDLFYRDAKQNLGLGEYQMRKGRGAITLAPGLHRLYPPTSIHEENLKPLGKMPHHVGRRLPLGEESIRRRLVDWLYEKFRHQTKPETIYRN